MRRLQRSPGSPPALRFSICFSRPCGMHGSRQWLSSGNALVIARGRCVRPDALCRAQHADDILMSMRFRVVLEYDPETQSYSAVCPELPGCATFGDTELEARANIEEAIRLYLEPADIPLSPDAHVVEVKVG